MYTYPISINEAAGILDVACPNWREKINIHILNMKQGENCILGQIYGEWIKGIIELFGKPGDKYHTYIRDNIFGYNADVQEWIRMIQKTDKVSETHNWNWALAQIESGKKVKLPDWNDEFIFLKNGYICTNGGHTYSFTPFLFTRTDWQIYEEWTLFSIAVGTKFRVCKTTPAIKNYLYQKIESPIDYDTFVCFINTDNGVFHAEPNKFAKTCEIVKVTL